MNKEVIEIDTNSILYYSLSTNFCNSLHSLNALDNRWYKYDNQVF